MTGARPFGRLVHDQQPGLEQQGAADRQHLLLAARELAAAILLALGQARKELIDARDGPRPSAARALRQAQMLVDRERGPDPPSLRHVADAEIGDPVGRQAQYVLAGEAGWRPRRAPGR